MRTLGFVLSSALALLVDLQGLASAQAETPSADLAASGLAAPGSSPVYKIVGFDQRQEYIADEREWREYLGKAMYRQAAASQALKIIGGLTLFAGGTALIVTFGNMAASTDYGRLSMPAAVNYQPLIYGFSGMLGGGAALLLTGFILSLPLPSRYRPVRIPRLQLIAPPAQPFGP